MAAVAKSSCPSDRASGMVVHPHNDACTRSRCNRRWFDQHRGGGLILPDGWLVDIDSEHRLTSLEERATA